MECPPHPDFRSHYARLCGMARISHLGWHRIGNLSRHTCLGWHNGGICRSGGRHGCLYATFRLGSTYVCCASPYATERKRTSGNGGHSQFSLSGGDPYLPVRSNVTLHSLASISTSSGAPAPVFHSTHP